MIKHYRPATHYEGQRKKISLALTTAAHTTGSGVSWLGHYRQKDGTINNYGVGNSIIFVRQGVDNVQHISILEETDGEDTINNALGRLKSLLETDLVEVPSK